MDLVVPADRLVNGNTVFYTFATLGYADFVRNLHESLLRADPELASSLVVFCADEETAEVLARSGIFTLTCEPTDLPEFVEFLGSGFGRLVSHKYELARMLLAQAEYVWWCDGDIVARAPLARRMESLMRTSDCDVLMQYESPKDVFNVGFWMARRGPAVDAMLADMIEYTTRSDWDDQSYFNERDFPGDGLRVSGLDPDEFMCGNRFYFTFVRRPPRCLLMHFNYSVGKATKKALMMGHGCWHLREPRTRWVMAKCRHLILVVATALGIHSPQEKFERSVQRLTRMWSRLAGR